MGQWLRRTIDPIVDLVEVGVKIPNEAMINEQHIQPRVQTFAFADQWWFETPCTLDQVGRKNPPVKKFQLGWHAGRLLSVRDKGEPCFTAP
jgi:hypothetical protein